MSIEQLQKKFHEEIDGLLRALQNADFEEIKLHHKGIGEITERVMKLQEPLVHKATDPWQIYMGCFYRSLGELIIQQIHFEEDLQEAKDLEAFLMELFGNMLQVVSVRRPDDGSGEG